MADGLFGTPTGFRTYDRDQAELGLLAGQTRHQDALTGLNQAQADVMRQKQASDDTKAKALARIAAGGPSPMQTAEAFERLIAQGQRVAGALFVVGDVEGAQKAANEAATLLSRTASAGAAAARQAVSEGQVLDQKAERIQQYLSGVRDVNSHAAALLAIRNDPMLKEDGVPPELETYNQGVVNSYISGTEALRRQVATKSDQARTAAYVASQASQRGRDAILNAQGAERLKLETRRTEHLEKGGGSADKPVGPPSTAAVKAMTKVLKNTGMYIDGPAGEAQALELAERAKRMVVATKGSMTETEAMNKVVAQAEKDGEIFPPAPAEENWIGWETKPANPGKWSPQTGTLTRPAPLPTSRSDLVPGKYYRDPKSGKMKQFTGTAFVDVAQAAMNPLAEEDDEGEE